MKKTSKKSFLISALTALTFASSGFILLMMDITDYGISLFCLIPIAMGLSSGILPKSKLAIAGMVISLLCFFVILLTGHWEGIICILMASPIVGLFILIGYLIARFVRGKTTNDPNLKTVFLPFLIFIFGNAIETFMGNSNVRQEVSTTIAIKDSPEEVYDKIIHVDTVDVNRPILLQLGLPTPYYCHLTEEKIGGKRICKFNEGTIVETITDFERGKKLHMEVSEFNLKTRKWLRFDEDLYAINQHGDSTYITRTTSFYSALKPRWYWAPLERLTVKTEQGFVFDNLKKDLKEPYFSNKN